ncbi:MAG: DNA mismatch repair endonuclease MutL [Candidatus Adiutrix sp.]|jgi:DNA mismatch repair protein MutL|nr:DNA mismatch repair endonuclease MutL [Candidatus Adiutrix sp.]
MPSETQARRRVKLLPDQLINRIAAGEVVERPGAVLKELVENSLDAGADRLDIDISGGGKRLIVVRDNGHGMDEDDLLMCLERHATSKIGAEADLMNIGTLGFRGEALPSIGSVARLAITSAVDGGEGHLVTVAAGRLLGLTPIAANRGTTVEVRDLFYNVPARRKFLKSDRTESAHLLDVAQSYALSRAGLRLTFRDNGREVLAVESAHDFQTRVFKVLGRGVAEGLTPLTYTRGDIKISGWLGSPDCGLPAPARLFVYVLGRPVKDRLLNRALADGYGRLLPRGTWPAAVIFLDLDPAEVDVNVHPAKAEVRFRRPAEIFAALAEAVAGAVGRAPVWAAGAGPAAPVLPVPPDLPAELPAESSVKGWPGPPADLPWLAPEFQSDPDEAPPGFDEPLADEPPPAALKPFFAGDPPAEPERPPAPLPANPNPAFSPAPARPGEAPNFEPLRPLAQLYQSYILAEGTRGLYLVDQHAAHERLLFNKLKRELTRAGLPSQTLLLPEPLDLPPQAALAAEKLKPHLAHLGFDLEPFGERGGFILRGVPAILGSQDPLPPLLEILAAGQGRLTALEGAGLQEALAALADSWLYSLACRAAVKAGEKISLEAMARLLEDMAREPGGAYCPHGRPAIQMIDRVTIERRFARR